MEKSLLQFYFIFLFFFSEGDCFYNVTEIWSVHEINYTILYFHSKLKLLLGKNIFFRSDKRLLQYYSIFLLVLEKVNKIKSHWEKRIHGSLKVQVFLQAVNYRVIRKVSTFSKKSEVSQI